MSFSAIRLWSASSLVIVVAALPHDLGAAEPSDVTGVWEISVESGQSPKSIELELDQRQAKWSVALRSNAGVATTSNVDMSGDVLKFQYGAKPFDVQVELSLVGETMRGTVVTGDGNTLRRRSVTARRAGSTNEVHTSGVEVESNETIEEARQFFGAWELSLRPPQAEAAGAVRMGMVVTQAEGRLVVGHSAFNMNGPQKRVNAVQTISDGLRWDYDGGMFGVLKVDLIPEGDMLRVKFTNANEETFIAGTAVRKPKAGDVGIDLDQLLQGPGAELVGVIDGGARVVEVVGDTVIVQRDQVVSRIAKDDPLLLLFEWFRLPPKSRLIAVESNTALSITGSMIQSWDIRRALDPTPLGSCEFPGNSLDVAGHAGELVFVANWNGQADTQQLHVIDVADPSAPILLSSHSTPKGGSNYDLAVSGHTLYLANSGGLRITDTTNPRGLVLTGNFEGRGRWVRGVDVVGLTAYIATSMHGGASWLQLVDVSDPSAPKQKGLYRSTGGAQDVAVSGHLAVLADRAAGIVVLDVSDPNDVRRVGYFRTDGRANNVDILGELAFVAVHGDTNKRTLQVIRFMK